VVLYSVFWVVFSIVGGTVFFDINRDFNVGGFGVIVSGFS